MPLFDIILNIMTFKLILIFALCFSFSMSLLCFGKEEYKTKHGCTTKKCVLIVKMFSLIQIQENFSVYRTCHSQTADLGYKEVPTEYSNSLQTYEKVE